MLDPSAAVGAMKGKDSKHEQASKHGWSLLRVRLNLNKEGF